ncbi:MAG: hypothetical protein U1E39_10820 [Planctomycetota bacterium]
MNPAVCSWCAAPLRRKDLAPTRTLVVCHACRRLTARLDGRVVPLPNNLGLVQHSAKRVRWARRGVRGGLAGGGPRSRARTLGIAVGLAWAALAVGFGLVGPWLRGSVGAPRFADVLRFLPFAFLGALPWSLRYVVRRQRDLVFGPGGVVVRGRGRTPVRVVDLFLDPRDGLDAVGSSLSVVVLDVHGERTTLATFGPLLRPHAEVLVSLLRRALGLAVPEPRPALRSDGFAEGVALAAQTMPSS